MKISRQLIQKEIQKVQRVIFEEYSNDEISKKMKHFSHLAFQLKKEINAFTEFGDPTHPGNATLSDIEPLLNKIVIILRDYVRAFPIKTTIDEASGFHIITPNDDVDVMDSEDELEPKKKLKRSKSDNGVIGFQTSKSKGIEDAPELDTNEILSRFHEGDTVKWSDDYINNQDQKTKRERTGVIVAIRGKAFPVAKVKTTGRNGEERFYYPTLSLLKKV